MSASTPPPLDLPHQVEGTQFLRDHERAALFDEQGLGKSKQVIDAISAEIDAGSIDAALIVCPNGLKSNWAGEVEKFSGRRYAVFGAGQSARRVAFRSLRAHFYIINYEAVPSEMASLKALMRFRHMAMILDESHRIKTPEARTTKAIHALRGFAARRYILSGTPVANTPQDLWSQMLFLDDGASLGATFSLFESQFKAGGRGYKNLDALRERILHRSLRRTKAGTLDLPGKTFTRVRVPLAGRQKAMYEQMRQELAVWVRGMDGQEFERRADAVLARLVRLTQLASNPALLDASYGEIPSKFQVLDGLLETYLQNPWQKILVWSSFVENIEALAARYARHHPVCIHGEVDNAARDAAVRAFKTDAGTRLLVANPAAAREGLTLTEANVAIYLDRTFNLVDYLQSQDRIHRISQTRPCEIIVLVGEGTIDELIDYVLEQKCRLARYTQSDSGEIAEDDAQRITPSSLRELLISPRERTKEAPRDEPTPSAH